MVTAAPSSLCSHSSFNGAKHQRGTGFGWQKGHPRWNRADPGAGTSRRTSRTGSAPWPSRCTAFYFSITKITQSQRPAHSSLNGAGAAPSAGCSRERLRLSQSPPALLLPGASSTRLTPASRHSFVTKSAAQPAAPEKRPSSPAVPNTLPKHPQLRRPRPLPQRRGDRPVPSANRAPGRHRLRAWDAAPGRGSERRESRPAAPRSRSRCRH